MNLAKVAVYFDRTTALKRWAAGENVFEIYLKHILEYAGIPFTWIENDVEISNEYDILILPVDPIEQSSNDRILEFILQGGALISYGGLKELGAMLGCRPKVIKKGYAEGLNEDNRVSLRFLKAITLEGLSDKVEIREERGILRSNTPIGEKAGAVYQIFTYGKGEVHRWAVDIIGSVVGFQQGTKPVMEDGVPAPDGTANIDDQLLKAEDGFELDWEWDRSITETGEKYFAYPYADLWKEILIAQLLRTALQKEKTLPIIDYWPEGIDQVAMISHDSDINQDESAEMTLEVLKECGLKTTWCMMEPGYSEKIYQKIEDEGHELAFHYNALETDDGYWSEAEFSRQLSWLKQVTGKSEVFSNKNHYTRFEKWGELFDWCEKHGILSDQTRGPSKKGNIGFLFGTCHPYFPVSWTDQNNRFYDVVEISFLTQDVDLDRLADNSIVKPFLQNVKMVRGVAHFLFHQIHIYRQQSVRQAVKFVTQEARKMGFIFWTGEQINRWVRERLEMKIIGLNPDGSIKVANAVENAVILIPVSSKENVNGNKMVNRYGLPCEKHVINGKYLIELGDKL
ncbi:hypothetical protein [Pseudalkalibacillus salsuginis]|uniref:hypothetical protein n=1 Tax=Pseudalkalibacillus salsuginis TaxID=2910972 RepID=UPI001F3A4A92|nr:hypothetical protein [Pseudalkalibacillus salsuginis]MCF6411619.1 hypothetical protein [Pseudalkalibacillus salsuginis]